MPPIGMTARNIREAMMMHGPDDEALIYNTINAVYFDMCAKIPWQRLRRTAEIAFGASDTAGKLLPSDLVGIIRVEDADAGTAGSDYHQTDESQRYQYSGRRKWYYKQEYIEPLVDAKYGSINQDSTQLSVSGVTLEASYVGEYVRISDQPGIYKITAVSGTTATISPRYRGPKVTRKQVQIRPEGTRKLMITEPEGDFSGDTVRVHYWAMPEPLFTDQQEPALPLNEPIEIKTMMILMRDHAKKLSQKRDLQAEFDNGNGDGAWWAAVALNPMPVMPVVPRGRNGSRITFGRVRG